MRRTNKLKGMYALLIAVAACVGITIYASCSADEDYGDYSSRDELFTLADGEMNLRSEGQGTVIFQGDSIPAGSCRVCSLALYEITSNPYFVPNPRTKYTVDIIIRWRNGWTGNQTGPHSTPYFDLFKNEPYALDSIVGNSEEGFYNYIYTFTQTDVEGDWISHDKLKITVKFWRYVNKYYYDIYNFTTGASAPWGPNEIIQFPQIIRVYKTFDNNELLNDTIIY